MSLNILITGGAGFIGSHTILELLNLNHNIICVDNFCNAYCEENSLFPESLIRVEKITGKKIIFYKVNIRDRSALEEVFKKHKIDCVIHFAALKAVGESCRLPLQYYQNNITGTSILLELMAEYNCYKLVYSSSATVYGDPQFLPLTESHPTGNCTNPYGKSKYFCEEIMKDLCSSNEKWNIFSLRYFNPVGAHISGLIGEDPNDEPNNLMPYISQVAIGRRKALKVFGNDYPTPDGTGVRDYLHIDDLAQGHVLALKVLSEGTIKGFAAYNLGTGSGYSVLDMVNGFAEASGRPIPYEFTPRRDGDIATSVSDVSLAKEVLGFQAKKGLKEICEDTWRWQSNNPKGYRKN